LHGQCTKTIDGNGASTDLCYAPRGVIVEKTNALGQKTHLSHDAFKREIRKQLPDTSVIQTVFSQRETSTQRLDSNDNVLRGIKSIEDAFHNVISHVDANGNATTTQLNPQDEWIQQTDENNNSVTRDLDFRGLQVKRTFTHHELNYQEITANDYDINALCVEETHDAEGKLKTNHQWNSLSQCILTEDVSTGSKSSTLYNQRGLLESKQHWLDENNSVNTNLEYNGLREIVQKSHADSTVKSSAKTDTIFDNFNRRIITVIDPEGLKLTTSTKYDDNDASISETDANGNTTYFVRDALSNVRFEINALGGVTEYRYNTANKVVFSCQYTTALDIKSLSALNEQTVSQSVQSTSLDRQINYYYDALMNERFRVTRAGYVVENRYDRAGNKTAEIQYGLPLSKSEFASTAEIINACQAIRHPEKDRATFRILDACAQEIFVIYGDGTVIEKQYHSAIHRVNTEIKYALKNKNAESLSALSIVDIKKQLLTSNEDRVSLWITDSLNRVTHYITPAGYVTRYEYLGSSLNKSRIISFNEPVALKSTYTENCDLVLALVFDEQKDSEETHEYDGIGREIKRTNPLGFSETFTYNTEGLRESHTTVLGYQWQYEYDQANRLTHEHSSQTTLYSTSLDSGTNQLVTTSTQTSIVKIMDHDKNGNVMSISTGWNTPEKSDIEFDEKITFYYNELNAFKSSYDVVLVINSTCVEFAYS